MTKCSYLPSLNYKYKSMKAYIKTALLCSLLPFHIWAQEGVTNAFEDLQRTGVVAEESSVMRDFASPSEVASLLKSLPASGFFCFAEDRMHDIRVYDSIPRRWLQKEMSLRNVVSDNASPGEFFTWQIGVYSPSENIEGVIVVFDDFVNEKGQRIKKENITCFNQEGMGADGKTFSKKLQVAKGTVKPLWCGVQLPTNASGVYTGKAIVRNAAGQESPVMIQLNVSGEALPNNGTNEGWRKSRLSWLNSTIGRANTPTAPYINLSVEKTKINYLGGYLELGSSGLPKAIVTKYDRSNQLNDNSSNNVLAQQMNFVIETSNGVQQLKGSAPRFIRKEGGMVVWESKASNKDFAVTYTGKMEFDGFVNYQIEVEAKQNVEVKDIRLEVPYTDYASQFIMGMGLQGGARKGKTLDWKWDTDKHQDKIWMGNVNAGLNFVFKGDNYSRPLVNIYYSKGKLNLPTSWGNENKGGVKVTDDTDNVLLTAYCGARTMTKGQREKFNFEMLITPVKPLDMATQSNERFYHSNSDLSSKYISEAKKGGANSINVHHKKDVYPFINYPYYDEALPELKAFMDKAHQEEMKVRLYYTTRELTVKIPELWALRSLGDEVIHDGKGKDERTLIHPNGPNEWLSRNLKTNFIPAWYNAFNEGKYKGDMDISVITTPDSRWNNYYLEGLSWMIDNLGLDGVYIDDSALDRETLKRGRRILDKDGKRRLIDIHSWNHMNEWAGFANSLHIYLELLPYVDRTWIGEGFGAHNALDFWLVEMSGIPFGLMSETLDAHNVYRGMVFGMLPRLPWSGNPTELWKVWDKLGMDKASFVGYWDERNPITTENESVPTSVFVNGDKAIVALANWTDMPQTINLKLNEELLGFKPSKVTLPEIRNVQWEGSKGLNRSHEIMGRSGMILLLEK